MRRFAAHTAEWNFLRPHPQKHPLGADLRLWDTAVALRLGMSKPEEKRKAIELRTGGLSYKDILQSAPVAKSTLSLWLRDVGLSVPQRQRLTARKLAAAHRGGEKVHLMRLERAARTFAEAEEEAKQQITRVIFYGSSALYCTGLKGPSPSPGEEERRSHLPTWIRARSS